MITRNAQIEHPTWYKFVSFYRGHGSSENRESEIDLIIEENGVLHQIEIKQGTNVNASEAAAFQIAVLPKNWTA